MTARFINEDCYSAKVVNCMVLGTAALCYRLKKTIVNKENYQIDSSSVSMVWVSILTGFLNFIGQMVLTMALNEAVKSNSNLGIVSALLTGTIALSLYASYFIYDEPITQLQATGSVVLLGGNSVLALFA
jgi:drug/metabolite transporter (DMT)-like permease